MWCKIRKILKGVLAGSTPSSVSCPVKGSLQHQGYLEPRSAVSLLNTEIRQHLLRQIWKNSLLPQTQYEQYFLAPLKLCVSLMQQLPATANGHHAALGGMVDYTLKTVVYAIRLSRGYMLPPGASAEEQSAQSAAWSAVVFYAALFHSLSSLRRIEGELLNGEIWYPGISVPGQPYRFRFSSDFPDGDREGLCTMLGMRLLPSEVILWMSKTPLALDTLLSFIRGDFEHTGVISQIVGDAIQHAGVDSSNIFSEPSVSESNIPYAATDVAMELTPAAVRAGEAVLPSEGHLQPLPDESIPLTSALDEKFPPTVSTAQDGQEVGDQMIQDAISLMGFEAGSSVYEAAPEQIDPVSQNMNGFPSDVSGCAESSGESASGTTRLLPLKTSHCDENEDFGQQFISWLSTKIISGALSVNTKEAQVHIVGDLIFLPTPNIFFSFMKDNAYVPSLKGDVQRAFESLGLHFIQKGKGVFSCLKYESENRKGRYKKISGYLIRSKIIYRLHPIPNDSPFLFVSNSS